MTVPSVKAMEAGHEAAAKAEEKAEAKAAVTTAEAGGNIERLSDLLFHEYLVPFEVASLLLLVAIVGSVVMARKKVD